MKYLTLKEDYSLLTIADARKDEPDLVISYILDKISEIEEFVPYESFAGEYVAEVLDSIPIDVKAFVKKILGKEYFGDFCRIRFWGLDFDCEKCGCLMEFWDYATDEEGHDIGKSYKCRNCKHIEIREDEKD